MKARDITNLPSELATDILLRLPLKTVFKIKCVSKGWNSFISQLSFQKQYRKAGYSGLQSKCIILSIFFNIKLQDKYPYSAEFADPSFRGRASNLLSEEEIFLRDNSIYYWDLCGYITASSNGLLLLSPSSRNFYVSDPLTKNYVKLPHTSRRRSNNVAIAFVCEINDCDDGYSMHYKVTCVEAHDRANTHVIETYSSETGKWKESLVSASLEFSFSPKTAGLVKGLFYWTEKERHRAVVYDPENIEGRLKLIELPLSKYCDQIFCESREGKVQLIRLGLQMTVWVLDQETSDESDTISASHWKMICRISSTNVGYDVTKYLLLVCVNLVDDQEKVIFVNGEKLLVFDWRTNSRDTVATFEYVIRRLIQCKQPIWPLLL